MIPHGEVALRKFQDADRTLLQGWLSRAHVARWYEHPADWLDEVDHRDGAYSFIRHFIAEYGGVPIGFAQYYEYCKGGETWHGDIDTAGAYSIDYLIGDPAYTGKGLGKAIVTELVARIGRRVGAKTVIVQPDPENKASCGALLSAGFAFDAVNKLYRFALPPQETSKGVYPQE